MFYAKKESEEYIMIYTTIPYKRQICKYSDKRYVYRDNRLKVIRKKIIKIPPDYTDVLGFLGASRTDDNKGILMTKHDNYERQQIFEDNFVISIILFSCGISLFFELL